MTSATTLQIQKRFLRFSSLALTAAVALSCADGSPTAVSSSASRADSRYSLTTVTVAPNPASVVAGGQRAFTAVGHDAFGRQLAIAPTWSVVAGGGSIHSSGLFTAGTVPGTYTNTVRATAGGISGLATVTVAPGVLATVIVTPNPDTLVAGGTRAFTAVGRDAAGNVVTLTPTWSVVAGGGAITGAGLFTAAGAPGTYAGTIRATSGSVTGIATVTIVVAPLATITITPNPAAIGWGRSQQFAAVGKDAAGNVVAIAPAWSVTAGGGTITGSGLFTAGNTPGTFANTVRATSGAVTGSATVAVAGPSIGLGAASLSYVAVVGGAAPAAQTLAINNTGSGTMTWTAAKVLGAAWLALAQTSGTAPSSIAVSASPAGLAAGTYRDTIVITATGAANTPQKVPVALTVTAAVNSAPDASRSTVAVGTASITTGATTTLTLQAKDAGGANLTTGGATVAFGNSAGTSVITIGAVTDNGNGTYTATVTGRSQGTASFSATLNGSTVTTPMPAITVTAAPGGYAAPNLLNASFETGEGGNGWSGFTDNSGGDPSPNSGAFTISRSTEHSYAGTYSVKSTYSANGADASVAFTSPPFSQATVYARVWLYRTGTVPDNHHKWIRFQTAGLNGVRGGLYLATGGVTWAEAANQNIDVNLGIGVPTAGTWHCVEVEYDRSLWNIAGKGPRVRFWYDGAVQVAGSQPGGTGNKAYWGDDAGNASLSGPWLYTGVGDGAASPSAYLVIDDTYNGGNTQSGAFYYDRIAVSSAGRIGP